MISERNQEIVDIINRAVAKAAEGLADGAFSNPERVVTNIAELCNVARYFKGDVPLRAPGETVESDSSWLPVSNVPPEELAF
jgi:hypothetical protein